MVTAAEHRVPKLPLKLVFEFAQNLLNDSLRWMVAPSARFQESNKIPLPSTELRTKIKARSKFTPFEKIGSKFAPFEKIATKIKTVVNQKRMKF